MSCSNMLTLYCVPAEDWQEKTDPLNDFSLFVEDALAIERRIQKGVNLVNERKRYYLCCRRIQDAALRKHGSYDSELLSEGYFSFLQEMRERYPDETARHRLASCFFPPDGVAAQIKYLQAVVKKLGNDEDKDIKKRIAFFEKALLKKSGVIEIPDFARFGVAVQDIGRTRKDSSTPKPEMFLDDELSDEQIRDISDILRKRIELALATGCDVNFSNQPHFIITEVLNEFVYQGEKGGPAASIRVVYQDGSEAESFPLRCFPPISEITDIGALPDALNISLVSMRHLEMDERVDFTWFRNRKVSSSLSCSETDAYCTAETIAALKSHQGPLNLAMYQTGLEPAVIGFYRGLAKILVARKQEPGAPLLRVIPYYYINGSYQAGKPWA